METATEATAKRDFGPDSRVQLPTRPNWVVERAPFSFSRYVRLFGEISSSWRRYSIN